MRYSIRLKNKCFGSNHFEILFQISVPKRYVKSLKSNCEGVIFIKRADYRTKTACY